MDIQDWFSIPAWLNTKTSNRLGCRRTSNRSSKRIALGIGGCRWSTLRMDHSSGCPDRCCITLFARRGRSAGPLQFDAQNDRPHIISVQPASIHPRLPVGTREPLSSWIERLRCRVLLVAFRGLQPATDRDCWRLGWRVSNNRHITFLTG